MPGEALRLEVKAYDGANRWRWLLSEHGGKFLADHEVTLDPADLRYRALFDLPGYLAFHTAPDTRAANEPRLIGEIGAWMGEHVLGRGITEKLFTRAKPAVVVRVVVPPEAERLLSLPLEIVQFNGVVLSRRGVSFVLQTTGEEPGDVRPAGERLRILALFSLPPVGSPLNLRRERQMLRKLVRSLTGAASRAVELRVLQYGVTRASLRRALRDGEGWDIIHFSGHGRPGALLLEKPDGSPDEVAAKDLVDLMRLAAGQVKLVTLSACLSAAATIEETLGWLKIVSNLTPRRDAASGAQEAANVAPTVASAIARGLGCAVLAMRYAVEDEFAILLAEALYESLLKDKQPLPEATSLALASVLGEDEDAQGIGALSAVAPALVGARAVGLTLVPPLAKSRTKVDPTLAYLPDEGAHFVGRVAMMARASTALAEKSGRSGVLFYGMAGAGKTSCALELAYHHAEVGRFPAFVWFKAPDRGTEIAPALRNFAMEMDRQIPGLNMVHLVDRRDELPDWLPQLVQALETNAVLVVLDNLESLLTEAGVWRDESWGLLMGALLTPGGLSRTVLTSRIRPAGLPVATEVISVHALPLDEALLLMRELPNLRRLLDGKATGVELEAGRDLVRRTLRLVQGHPELIKQAEALAAEPEKLTAQLARADAAQSAGAGELDAFFTTGESRFDEAAFLASLRSWTGGIAGALPEPARLFFQVLCAIEEGDREGWIIAANWNDVWKRLGRPAPAPERAGLLAQLVAAGLVDKQAVGKDADAFRVAIHPGVAEAGRAASDPAIQAAVDQELAATWGTLMQQNLRLHGTDPTAGAMIVRAGLAAFPYLARRGEWAVAATMLERAVQLDQSHGTIAAVLPLVRRIAEATTGTDREALDRGLLARLLRLAGRLDEAEALLRDVIKQAAARGDFGTASTASGDLANLLWDAGRFESALQVLEQKAEYIRRAGRGPWTLLADEVRRLQILNALGRNKEVLARVIELRAQMASLPDPPGPNDWSVNVWNVREATLDTGRSAAVELEEWQQALDLNAENRASEERRGAESLERAGSRFNDYGPLLGLQRYGEARAVLEHCRAVFEQENAVANLGSVFSALADLENNLDHHVAAKQFEENALRYKYLAGTPDSAAISHFNLANYLTRTGGGWRNVLGHRLAAVLIFAATRSGRTAGSIAALAVNLRQAGAEADGALPADFAGLCATVEAIPGVRFRELMQKLLPGEGAPDAALREVIADAKQRAAAPDDKNQTGAPPP